MFGITSSKLTAALVVAAAAVPVAASARPIDMVSGPSTITPSSYVVPSAPAASSSSDSGFQWGDAGIGAATVLVLMGAGTAAVSGTRRRGGRVPA